ncbi:MAG: GAF domain-containing protein [Anaerolineae bacterium]
MNRPRFILLSTILAAVLTGAVLLSNLPGGDTLGSYGWQALVFMLLIAATLYLSVTLAQGKFSPAHAVAMTAVLSQPADALPLMLWCIALGGALGGLLRYGADLRGRKWTDGPLANVLLITARMTLSTYLGVQVYLLFSGELPFRPPLREVLAPLVAFSLVTSVVYTLIYLLEIRVDGLSWRNLLPYRWLIVGVLTVPVPFGVMAAVVISLTPSSIIIFAIGTLLVALGLNRFSDTQYRLRKQVDELRSISAVSQALQSGLKLDLLLYAVYNQVEQLMHTDQFVVALYNRSRQQLTFPLVVLDGEPLKGESESTEHTLIGHVLRREMPLLIGHDVAEKAEQLGLQAPDEGVQSWLGVPLLARGHLLGAIVISSNNPQQHFTPEDERLLTIVATSASVAIDNAQLYEEQTSRANQLSALNRALPQLTGTLSMDEVMKAIVTAATEISESNATAIYLFWGEDRQALALARSSGLSTHFLAEPVHPLSTRQTRQPVLVADVTHDERAAASRESLAREGKAAWAELPLEVGDDMLGVIMFFYDRPQQFSDDDIEILRTFANQSAQSIRNARQYATTDQALVRQVEQMYALAMLGRQITAGMDVREICAMVLNRALELHQQAAGFVMLQNSLTGTSEVTAQNGYPPSVTLTADVLMQSLTGRALRDGKLLRLHDVRTVQPEHPLLPATRSQLTVPLISAGEICGAITLESERPEAFSEEDTYFLSQMANQMMTAVDNMRLFQNVAETRDRLQVILDTMTEGIVLIDRSGLVVLANPRVNMIALEAASMLGQKVDDLLERPDLDLAERMGFESDQKVRKLLKEIRTPGAWSDVPPHSYAVTTAGDERHIERRIFPIRSNNGEPLGLLLVFYDETEAHELLQMRADLSDMIVHDLRSPLTAVTTGLKLMRDIVPPDNPLRPTVVTTTETSQRAIRKMMARVDSLLDISRNDSGQLELETEPTDLATVADSVCVELSPLAQELEVTLTTDIDEETPDLNIDPDKVERVLQNLVDNALKFCPASGYVTIRAHPLLQADTGRRMVRIEVVDTGPGIPDEHKTRLFERFSQIKGRRGTRRGTGLGLTFCKLVVEAHGGTIWIEDNPGGGSIFAFTLPVADMDLDDN